MSGSRRDDVAAGWLESYGLIGDGRSAALVGRNGSIDWLCWPRFDGDTCFTALLGTPGNGFWQVAPTAEATGTHRHYRPGSAILHTLFETARGTLELIDFMPWSCRDGRSVIRRAICREGRVTVRSELLAKYGYGRVSPWCTRRDARWRMVMGPVAVWLDAAPEHRLAEDGALLAEQTLAAGDVCDFVLHCAPSWCDAVPSIEVGEALDSTAAFWDRWSSQHAFRGPFAEQALRSLITLKMLTDRDTGGVVAAPTSSLPEQLGGGRNWDYRYGWLRDASFTLTAFAASGFGDDAARWRDWIVRCIAGDPAQLQIMYAIDGSRRLDEWECEWLTGYQGARPVRFGNAAAGQLQIDVFGEVIHALYQARQHGLHPEREIWDVECRLVEHLARIWERPGHGIWEMRGDPRVFTLSRAMAWVGVDRALRSACEFDLPAPIEKWTRLARTIHEDVLAHGVHPDRGCFTQVYGESALDASLLLLPIYGFLPANDPRVVATVDAVEQDLGERGYLMRYRADGASDGQSGGEGSFLACNFWLAHVKVLQGKTGEARDLIERFLACGNDLGLLSEEYDTEARRQCGNVPQALSHVALLNAVMALAGKGD